MKSLAVMVLVVGLATGCGKTGPVTAGGKPAEYWLKELHAPDAGSRKKAARKLGNIGSADPASLPALREALKDPDPGVRLATIEALVHFGKSAAGAAPALKTMKERDPDLQVRELAARVLPKILGE